MGWDGMEWEIPGASRDGTRQFGWDWVYVVDLFLFFCLTTLRSRVGTDTRDEERKGGMDCCINARWR